LAIAKTARSVEIAATAEAVALVEIVAEVAVVASVVSVVVQAQARVAMALEARLVEIVVMAPEVRRVGTAVTALGPEVPAVSEIVIVVVMEETTARSASGCRSRRTFR
jgi:hypothetical protein